MIFEDASRKNAVVFCGWGSKRQDGDSFRFEFRSGFVGWMVLDLEVVRKEDKTVERKPSLGFN